MVEQFRRRIEDFSEFDIYEYYNRMTDEIESEGGELIDELE